MWNKILVLFLALCLCASCSSSKETIDTTDKDVTVVQANNQNSNDNKAKESNLDVDKSENIMAKAKPDGSIYETKVEVTLKHNDQDTIQDKSNLSNIKNNKGDETYTTKDNIIYWENKGEDIVYKGDSNQSLPVSMNISYKLDNKTVDYNTLKDISGHIDITYSFMNNSDIDGSIVPFMTLTLLNLDTDSVSNVEIDNGKIINYDDMLIAVGMTTPGLENAFHFNSDIDEEVEFNDTFTLSFDATNYTLDYSATIINNGLFEDLEDKTINKMIDLNDDINDFNEASDELSDGLQEYYDAMMDFKEVSHDVKVGIDQIADGNHELYKGVLALNNNTSSLVSGANTLYNSMSQINTMVAQISSSTGDSSNQLSEAVAALMSDLTAISTYANYISESATKLNTKVEEVNYKIDEVNNSISSIEEYKNNLNSKLSSLQTTKESLLTIIDTLEDSDTKTQLQQEVNNLDVSIDQLTIDINKLDSFTLDSCDVDIAAVMTDLSTQITKLQTSLQGLAAYASLADYFNQLTQGSQQLASGVSTFANAISQLKDGSEKLDEGAQALSEAYDEVNTGTYEIADASKEIKDGFDEYREEGVDELLDQLKSVVTLGNDLKKLKNADVSYDNFSGKVDNSKTNVMFVIETDSLVDD